MSDLVTHQREQASSVDDRLGMAAAQRGNVVVVKLLVLLDGLREVVPLRKRLGELAAGRPGVGVAPVQHTGAPAASRSYSARSTSRAAWRSSRSNSTSAQVATATPDSRPVRW